MSGSDSKRLIEGVSRLTEPLAERDADPAGGAAAGAVAAMAASLAAATADRSREQWEGAAGSRAQAQFLRRRALMLAEKDADAYAEARAALTDRGHAGDAQDRDARIGATVSQAAQIPLQISATAADIAHLSAEIATHGNAEVRADAAIAAILAAAAAEAAAHLVEINLIAGADQELVTLAQRRAEAASSAASAATEQD